MKKTFVSLLIIMLTGLAFGQTAEESAVVAAVKMNVLYRGVQNPIEISVPGVKYDAVSAMTDCGTLTKKGRTWYISPGSGAVCTITVSVNGNKVANKEFRVKSIPVPVAVFAGKSEGTLEKEMAMTCDSINAWLPDFLWDMRFNISSFKFFASVNGSDIILETNGNMLTERMKSIIAGYEKGKSIVFQDIVAIAPDGYQKKLNNITIKIK
jgi:gliding motility-associated protein GldM